MKGVRTMFGRLFLSTGSDTFAGAKAKSFAPSAPPYSIYDRLVLTITCTLPSSKNNEFFLHRRLTRQKKWIFSAPEGHASKKNEFFLRRRVTRQKKTSFFCAGGSRVKRKRIFSAPEGRASKNNGFFLHRRFVHSKNRFPQQVRSISVLKIFSFAHFFLHLPT